MQLKPSRRNDLKEKYMFGASLSKKKENYTGEKQSIGGDSKQYSEE